MEKKPNKLGISLKYKLLFLMALLLLGSLGANTWTSVSIFNEDKNAYIFQTNSILSNSLANETEQMLISTITLLNTTAGLIDAKKVSQKQNKVAIESVLRSAADIVDLVAYRVPSHKPVFELQRKNHLKVYNLNADYLTRLRREKAVPFEEVKRHGVYFQNSSKPGGIPLFTIAMSTYSKGQNKRDLVLVAHIKLDRLLKVFNQTHEHVTYLLDPGGNLLAHPDSDRILKNDNLSQIPIISQILNAKGSQQQTIEFTWEDGQVYLGTFRKIGIGNLTVVTQIHKDKAFYASRLLMEKNIKLGLMVIFLSIFLSIIFSQKLTESLRTLFRATRKIASGDFNVTVNVKSNDEVGALSQSFNSMAKEIVLHIDQTKKAVAEKETIRSTFSRYLAPKVVEKIMINPDNMEMGGETKNISMLFSDVRNFTTISENLSPRDLSSALNRYMTEWTQIVFDYEGTIDNYVGDAVVAFWGAPFEIENHAYHAVQGALKMLETMPKINEEFRKLNYPQYNIGVGINSGPVSVGNMGSELIYSYTALGDNMNLAARMEGLCKYYGADFLFTDQTLEAMGEKGSEVRFRTLDHAIVKGKSTAVHILEGLHKHHPMYDDESTIVSFNHAYDLYRNREFKEASKLFNEVVKKYPEDVSTKRLVGACKELSREKPPKEWTGVTVHDSK